jgi:glutamyl-tRNA synthetase
VVNFSETDPFDPKALWLNAEHLRALPAEELAPLLRPFLEAAGFTVTEEKVHAVAPLVRERIRLLGDVVSVADFFFAEKLAPYDPAELIPQKGDRAMAQRALEKARAVLATADFSHAGLEAALRSAAEELKIKTGQMFQPVRVAVCGRKNAPPLFETLAVLGRDTCQERIAAALALLAAPQEATTPT